jgi:glucosamine--fructose-6-phosphate aminotransferase (isomerizing)
MCGILLIISKNECNIIKYLLQGLKLIQNRGYDSVGICFKNDEKFNNYLDEIENFDKVTNSNINYKIIKYASSDTFDSLQKLENNLNNFNIKSSMGFAHTRWATHGSKTINNAHPHISYYRNTIVIHNGIINNYKMIKTFLISKGFKFYSETDSEVIANLIEYYYLYDNDCKNNFEKCIFNLNKNLEGTWALAIINTNDKENIYITRHGSPLVLGYSDTLFICASEINGFAGLVLNYIVLENNDIIKINRYNYTSSNIKKYAIENISNSEIVETPYPYEHWTLKEIMEQPISINNAINNGGRIINNRIKLGGLESLFSELENNFYNIKHIMLFGCGTSYHACLLAKYYFNNKKNIHVIDACEFIENDIPNVGENEKILAIFCSQSGETIDIVKCIEICNKFNIITYGVINVIDSLISRLVSFGTYINAGPEIAVASTKSFTNTSIILSLIAYYFYDRINCIEQINSLRLLPTTINNILYDKNINSVLDNISEYIITNNINNIFILGKNKLYPIAKEISFK